MVGRCCTPRRITPSSSYLRLAWVCRPPARMHVRLLGPCFKTGRMKSPLRRRPERAGAPEARPPKGRALPPKKGILGLPDGIGRPRRPTFIPPEAHADQRPASSGGPAYAAVPHPTGRTRGLHSLPSQQFQALFNSLFKVLFIFPSRYLFAIGLPPVFSLGRNLPPSSAFPNSPTRRQRLVEQQAPARRGSHPLRRPFPGDLGRVRCRGHFSRLQLAPRNGAIFKLALPGSLAATKGILVSFFSSA
ncbi:hypothetical protein R1flu_003950 [Riccia fluitans]|uniref:Uncharacterized protein n=1 Tax=Riccia fluitans TaxID=41844 RepID=A0ABD1YNX4_9MARC